MYQMHSNIAETILKHTQTHSLNDIGDFRFEIFFSANFRVSQQQLIGILDNTVYIHVCAAWIAVCGNHIHGLQKLRKYEKLSQSQSFNVDPVLGHPTFQTRFQSHNDVDVRTACVEKGQLFEATTHQGDVECPQMASEWSTCSWVLCNRRQVLSMHTNSLGWQEICGEGR